MSAAIVGKEHGINPTTIYGGLGRGVKGMPPLGDPELLTLLR